MALITNPLTVGYNVQEVCNQLGLNSSFNAEFNKIHIAAGDAAASTTTAETAIAFLKTGQTLARLVIVPTGAVTAHDTTYATITVAKRDGAGGAATTLGEVTTKITGGTGDWTAFVPLSMGTLAATAIAAGSVITYKVAKASTGVQLPALTVFAEFA